MKKPLPRLLLALVLVCGFTACGAPTYITAGISIEATRIERAGDGTVRVTWHVKNPNVSAYLLARTNHKLSLNGTLVGTLSDTSPFGVPPQNQAERTTILTPVNPPADAVLQQAVAQGSAAYRLDSTVHLLIVEDKTEKIPLTHSGTVTVTAK
jgi:hypothetical protein